MEYEKSLINKLTELLRDYELCNRKHHTCQGAGVFSPNEEGTC